MTLRATRTVRVVASLDPNDKRGPTGNDGDLLSDPACVEETADRTVQQNCGLGIFFYTIHFENLANEEIGEDIDGDRDDHCGRVVDALEVVIDDALDLESFDLSTLRFREASFGETVRRFISIDPSDPSNPGRSFGYLEIDMEAPDHDPERRWFVSVAASVDGDGAASWRFITRDREPRSTFDDAVSSDCEGFLSPGVGGFVSFSVSLSAEALLSERKRIKNTASIVFDTNEAIDTCPWEDEVSEEFCIDQLAPTLPSPPNGTGSVDAIPTLGWDFRSPDVEYSVFFWKTGENPQLSIEGLTGTGWSPGPLEAGTSYTWKVLSTVGGLVTESVEWEFTTERTDELFIRGDANSDGILNIADPVAILGWAFRGGDNPPPRCIDAADADDNGSIQISDPLRILGWLFKGQDPSRQPGPTVGFPRENCDIDPTPDSATDPDFDLGCEEASLKCRG